MKKVIEVLRGEPVPNNAKWLKDFSKITGTKPEWDDDGQCAGYVDVPIYSTFDVFEVTYEPWQLKPREYCRNCGCERCEKGP